MRIRHDMNFLCFTQDRFTCVIHSNPKSQPGPCGILQAEVTRQGRNAAMHTWRQTQLRRGRLELGQDDFTFTFSAY